MNNLIVVLQMALSVPGVIADVVRYYVVMPVAVMAVILSVVVAGGWLWRWRRRAVVMRDAKPGCKFAWKSTNGK